MQVIVMTSNGKEKILQGFFYQWDKHFSTDYEAEIVICGFAKNVDYFIGNFSDYPADKWSNALLKVLDNVADEVFLLLLDDYWLTRQVDTIALKMMYDYMFQFQNVLKFDVAYDRLGAWGADLHYNTLGYLDLVKSDHASQYHMSLWGGLWRRDLMKKIIIPNETAQQIELNGTTRLAQFGDEMLVLGTRQAPLFHANVIQNAEWNSDTQVGLPALKENDREELKKLGVL